MFEVGKQYEFKMLDDGEVTFSGIVETYEHPLLKLADSAPVTVNVSAFGSDEVVSSYTIPSYPGRIINVTSSNFIGAVRKDAD